MKIAKGDAGYIQNKKKQELCKVILEFGMVGLVFFTGYITTKTRLNLLTLVAVLGCLPASKALVGYMMLFPRKSLESTKVNEIEQKGKHLMKLYDMILTSYDHIMPIDQIVIDGNTICGYTKSEKIDFAYAEKYIKKTLANNGIAQASVKIYQDYAKYILRVEEMENHACSVKQNGIKRDETIKEIILSLSM